MDARVKPGHDDGEQQRWRYAPAPGDSADRHTDVSNKYYPASVALVPVHHWQATNNRIHILQ